MYKLKTSANYHRTGKDSDQEYKKREQKRPDSHRKRNKNRKYKNGKSYSSGDKHKDSKSVVKKSKSSYNLETEDPDHYRFDYGDLIHDKRYKVSYQFFIAFRLSNI